MSEVIQRISDFISYAKLLKGDEKGEAQVFCDRLFRAFGHAGYAEAGATLEFRIKKASGKGVNFADLIWKPRLLLEMKKSGEKLATHYQQAFDYWVNAVPDRPRYVVLCNFSEFWIYDLDKQLNEPVDVVPLDELGHRYTALNFLFPHDPPPLFGNDREEVSRAAAGKMAKLFRSMVDRGIPREEAQRWVLQAILAMFAEDIDLMPSGTTLRLVQDCLQHGQNAYDMFGGLFRQMNTKKQAPAGRFKGIPYFNGGLFATIEPIDLTTEELLLIGEPEKGAAWENWSKINPSIFGTIFQQSMDKGERHARGAHFTHEADIQRIIGPTITQPWRERIENAKTMKELVALRSELMEFTVLDPACGSGNFLYVAYRELVRLEIQILARLEKEFSWQKVQKVTQSTSLISPRQFYGLDRDSFGVELAKVTLMIAKKLALEEAAAALEREQIDLPLLAGEALPLDNLDNNIVCDDALFADWPKVDTIIGNPPYQSKSKVQKEYGRAYMNRVRAAHPEVDGRADYCVYWFRKAHDELRPGQRAGMVGTNTIRQNYSRISGLDQIVANEGTIIEAVSTMAWSGDASVDVSIVNWVKGPKPGKKKLFTQKGSDPSQGWSYKELDNINSALSFGKDVSGAKVIRANAKSQVCFQGQTPGHDGFLLTEEEASEIIAANPKSAAVIHPILIGNELTGQKDSLPNRYVIDFHPGDLFASQKHKALLARIQKSVLPDREEAAREEKKRNDEALAENPKASVARHHQGFLNRWWQLSWPRGDMKDAVAGLSRYIGCSRVTLRPIFEFIDPAIRPNDLISVFALEDDYSFGILQSNIHWMWFTHRCSTQNGRPRYTSESIFDTFPWPQKPGQAAVKKVAEAAVALRALRRKLKQDNNLSFRELYRTLDLPGTNPLKDAHEVLDKAVRAAYGMSRKSDVLTHLLDLNAALSTAEANGEKVVAPGVPPAVKKAGLVTTDCLRMSPNSESAAA
ncbi:class I SAM-dependent DNA methyltransferase [Rhizobium lentis]|uniref:DNA methyltransferase n=1 Tax=Rhizobium lentis TaxID=1138194 RepID=UPI001C838BE0|nr:DNA methyltransferase [Rhizobium lentis]MBX5177321.1 class I SAM-dependent DNA methyltransferase [Rhizobium lentis]